MLEGPGTLMRAGGGGEGRAAGAVAYDSQEALAATREATKLIRAEAVQEVGAEIMEVGEFEVAMAHLRVPELV